LFVNVSVCALYGDKVRFKVGATHKNAHILVEKILEEWGYQPPFYLM
jgi:hypothetical protein